MPACDATNEISVTVAVELKNIIAYKDGQGITFVEGKPLFDFAPKQGSTQLIKGHWGGTNADRGP